MRVGFVGWRGMVGSVLLDRMREEHDFDGISPVFFSTSQIGQPPPKVGVDAPALQDAYDIEALAGQEVILSCQGGSYTSRVHPALRQAGWRGLWIDAASTLRMQPNAVIVLDPINRHDIDEALTRGVLDYIGGNCTVSLMLMAIAGLYRRGWLSWVHAMTYQAASGAGAGPLRELVEQMGALGAAGQEMAAHPGHSIVDLERAVTQTMRSEAFPTSALGYALAGNVLPWVDAGLDDGRTREEWKGAVESKKIMGLPEDQSVAVDGICVRVGALRCHSQALVMALRQDVPLDEVDAAIAESTPWTRWVPNTQEETRARLTPAAVTGTLDVAIGRVRQLRTSPRHIGAFTVGDQLLWGAAEPLRRMLRIVREHRGH